MTRPLPKRVREFLEKQCRDSGVPLIVTDRKTVGDLADLLKSSAPLHEEVSR